MKNVTLITNTNTGKITSVIIRTSAVWYYVSPRYVKETVAMKFCPPAFVEAEKKIKELEG